MGLDHRKRIGPATVDHGIDRRRLGPDVIDGAQRDHAEHDIMDNLRHRRLTLSTYEAGIIGSDLKSSQSDWSCMGEGPYVRRLGFNFMRTYRTYEVFSLRR